METHLRILKTMAPYAAINFIRNGMGYEEYLQEYARYRKIKPEELMETLNRIHESARGMKTLEEWMAYQKAGRTGEETGCETGRSGDIHSSCGQRSGI